MIRIGDHTLEVKGGSATSAGEYYVNGELGDMRAKDFLFSSLGLKVNVKQRTANAFVVRLDLLNADAVSFEVYNKFVRVNMNEKDPKWKKFAGSVGLMGAYPNGEAIGRDGKTVFTDMNAFGQVSGSV